ncbi:carbohydrate ABC transporter permease [Streptomyces sp. NPDC014734]|uniref:carbohydrate ABC transporter permease n=1 Tax=Streptomyces sp. NPDC014734 TaxID=3364886 RepID=UPI0036F8914E
MSASTMTRTSGPAKPPPSPVDGPKALTSAQRRRTRRRSALNALAVLASLVWVFPVYWMVNTAFVPTSELFGLTPKFVPFPGTFEHFSGVLQDDKFWSALRMSAAVTSVVVVLAVLFGFMAAVAASRFRFKGRGALVMLVIVVQMLPAEALFISQFRMLDDWDLLSTVTGLSLLCLGGNVPFTMWLLRGFIDNIPAELEEAAMVDGCSRVGAFFRVTLPLLGPGLVTSSVFAFLHTWNEYNLALIVMTKTDHATLPLWLRSFSSETSATDWGGVMAGSALIAVPVIALFMSVHSRMSSGLVAGAVKG